MIRIWLGLSTGNDSSSELRASINVLYELNRLIGSETYQRASVVKGVGTAIWQDRDFFGWRMLQVVNFKIFLPYKHSRKYKQIQENISFEKKTSCRDF